MLFWTIVKVAIKSLLANKLRAFLSMLGIIIGVAAVISMLAIGAGAQKQVVDRITSLGANLLIVRAGQPWHRGVRSGDAETLVLDDALALVEEIPDISMVSPVVRGGAQFKYLNQNTQSSIYGVAPTYLQIRNYEVEKGRMFTDGECQQVARVAVLGPVTAENLFGEADPRNETVRINGKNFKVIGVLKAKGEQGHHNPDDQAMVPYTTAMKQMLGVDFLREIDMQIAQEADQEEVQLQIEQLLRKRHRIREEEEEDFYVRNMVEMVETASEVTRTFTILLGAVAAISLLVGGIGIMNIMLVTVTERTREIGIRKAIGAKNRDVLVQFLLEAVLMSGLGGFLGVGTGMGLAGTVSRFSPFVPVVEIYSVLLALGFSAAVGIFFGFYPARRAALLDPIQALQYE